MKQVLVTSALILSARLASAEAFVCQGTGRFAVVDNQRFELQWRDKAQKVLMDGKDVKVLASIDKANSDGTHYLSVDVLELRNEKNPIVRGAKGSLRDMVQYADGAESMISCVPVR